MGAAWIKAKLFDIRNEQEVCLVFVHCTTDQLSAFSQGPEDNHQAEESGVGRLLCPPPRGQGGGAGGRADGGEGGPGGGKAGGGAEEGGGGWTAAGPGQAGVRWQQQSGCKLNCGQLINTMYDCWNGN